MKKRIFIILAIGLSAVTMPACASIGLDEAELTDDAGEEEDENDTAENGTSESEKAMSLSEDLKAAVCDALINQCGSDYSQADFIIPSFHILDANDESAGDIMVWGDFWRYAYNLEDDTLVSVAGEDVSGCMHLQEQDGEYQFISIDVPTAGSTKEETSEKIFGASYQYLLHWREDYGKQEGTRAQLIADYASAYGISAVKYKDYNWEPEKLPTPSSNSDNIFLYMLQEKGTESDVEDVEVLPATEETSAEEATATEETPAAEASANEDYIVKKGDTLGEIARTHGIKTSALAEMNRDTILRYAHRYGIRSNDLRICEDYIYPGEVLIVPVSK